MKKYIKLAFAGCSLWLTACTGNSQSSGKPYYHIVSNDQKPTNSADTRPACQLRDKTITGLTNNSCRLKDSSIPADIIITCRNVGNKYIMLNGTFRTLSSKKGIHLSGFSVDGYVLQCP